MSKLRISKFKRVFAGAMAMIVALSGVHVAGSTVNLDAASRNVSIFITDPSGGSSLGDVNGRWVPVGAEKELQTAYNTPYIQTDQGEVKLDRRGISQMKVTGGGFDNFVNCVEMFTKASLDGSNTSAKWESIAMNNPALMEELWAISYYGLGYQGDFSVERGMAMQIATWEAIPLDVAYPNGEITEKVDGVMTTFTGVHGKPRFEMTEFWTGYGVSEAKYNAAKAEILSLVSQSGVVPRTDLTEVEYVIGKDFTIPFRRSINSSEYELKLPAGVELVSLTNDAAVIKVTDVVDENARVSISHKTLENTNVRNGSETSFILDAQGTSQALITIGDPTLGFNLPFRQALGDGSIVKTDSQLQVVDGLKFELSKDKETVLETVETDADGIALFEGYVPGEYFFREVATVGAEHITIDTNWKPITIVENSTAVIDVVNEVISSIKTEAYFLSRDEANTDLITLIDEVTYSNLRVGKEYTISGELMDKDTGEAILDINGDTITGSTTFTPTEKDGVVDVAFVFDNAGVDIEQVVVFERLYINSHEVTNHLDINDEKQTVNIPEIKTKAYFVDRELDEGKDIVRITDKINYVNLIVGKEYTAQGHLMNPETNEPYLLDGELIEAETVFTAEATHGVVEVEFEFDVAALKAELGKDLEVDGDIPLVPLDPALPLEDVEGEEDVEGVIDSGLKVVVFEKLYNDLGLVAVHTDINDEFQTVEIPELHTEAIYEGRDEEDSNIGIIVDQVTYTGLVIGKEYTVKGVLLDKDTEQPLIIDGEEVRGETTFVAETTSGVVDVEFRVDQSQLLSNTVVVFEELYDGDYLFAYHKDVNDEKQKVEILRARIVKLDADERFALEGVGFGLYDAEGRELEVKYTDAEGIVEFVLFEGDVVDIKEVKPLPKYNGTDEVIRIEAEAVEGNLYTYEVLNSKLPVPPMLATPVGKAVVAIGVALVGVALVGAGVLAKGRKKEDEEEEI